VREDGRTEGGGRRGTKGREENEELPNRTKTALHYITYSIRLATARGEGRGREGKRLNAFSPS